MPTRPATTRAIPRAARCVTALTVLSLLAPAAGALAPQPAGADRPQFAAPVWAAPAPADTAIAVVGTLLSAGMAEHVVAFALFLIAQYFIGFIDFFEFFFGGLFLMVAGVEIRMVLAGQFPVRLLQLVVGDVPIDTERFVVIAF